MRKHPVDGLLFQLMKSLKSLDKRQTSLEHFSPTAVKNILVVSSTAIGDTLLSTPAIRAVRERYPQAKIRAHFNAGIAELFENNPHIDGIIPYYGGYRRFMRTILEFRKHNFDLALIFHGNEPQATPMAYLSGARFIIKVPISREYGFLLSNISNGFDKPWDHHAIDVRMKAAEFAGCMGDNREMVLVADEGDRAAASFYLSRLGTDQNVILIGLQVGAATPYKMWPQHKFVELGKRLVQLNPDIRILVTGSPRERRLCSSVAREIGDHAFATAAQISLKTLRGLIERMDLLVTNDTGTMHMAIALKTKTISLFCPTSPRGVGPLQDPQLHRVVHRDKPCNPCITKKCRKPLCMDLIQVDEVYEAARKVLQE
ncbi:MAG TPA: glycosyltransferase family 9 protein [Dissulfurispiraceae bacterium]|nr:glycosyltransferase family 9 protein [Dissulfurispiraceae bacterium]